MIGTALLISITVLLAATTAAFVFSFGPDSGETRAPNIAIDFDYDKEAGGVDTVKIAQAGGDTTAAKNLYLAVDGASASSGTADGKYDLTSVSGLRAGSDVVAGTSLTLGSNLVSGSPSSVDLSSATISVNWQNPNSGESIRIAVWNGPKA